RSRHDVAASGAAGLGPENLRAAPARGLVRRQRAASGDAIRPDPRPLQPGRRRRLEFHDFRPDHRSRYHLSGHRREELAGAVEAELPGALPRRESGRSLRREIHRHRQDHADSARYQRDPRFVRRRRLPRHDGFRPERASRNGRAADRGAGHRRDPRAGGRRARFDSGPPLGKSYERASCAINANVAAATHGETVQELLGGGDAGAKFQTFKLRQPPLTYGSAANAEGAASTLEVRVNDLLWHEAPTLYGKESKDRVYIARRGGDGATAIQFGDGVTGARPPSGQSNIRARYRKGIGIDGLVKAGQLSMLLSRPLGVKGVTNPEASTGAQDPEQLDDARANAPLKVLTLERVVSLSDYENFARAFGAIAKALASWTWDGRNRGVLVTVAGPGGAAVPPGSATYDNLLAALRAAGDPFVELRVKTFRPAYFRFAGNVKVDGDFASEQVLAAVEQALRDEFSFAARSFGQPVRLSEVIAAIQAVPGVIAVDVDKLYRSGGAPSLQQRLLAQLPVL